MFAGQTIERRARFDVPTACILAIAVRVPAASTAPAATATTFVTFTIFLRLSFLLRSIGGGFLVAFCRSRRTGDFDLVVAVVRVVGVLLVGAHRIRLVAVHGGIFLVLVAAFNHGLAALLEAAFAVLLLQQTFTRHRRGHNAIIVFGVLEIVLVLHAITARLGVTRVLSVLLVNLRSRAADLYIRPVALKRSVAVVVVVVTTAAAAGLTPAPPLTLHETFPDLQSIRPIGRNAVCHSQTQKQTLADYH